MSSGPGGDAVRRCGPGRDEGAGWRSGTEMEIRDLRALLAVVRSGSFTAAARELGYTQPAISQQVAALELELGQPLVQRRPVSGTPSTRRGSCSGWTWPAAS